MSNKISATNNNYECTSGFAFPLSFVAHNEMLVRNAERALSQLSTLDDTKVYIKNPDGTTIRLQPGCKIMYFQYIGKAVEE